MSIYLDEKNPGQHKPFQDASKDVVDYVRYLEVIAGKSPNTAFNYYCDLRNFSKFMKKRRGLVPEDAEMKEIDPKGLDTAFWGSVTREDIYEYLRLLGQRHPGGYLRVPLLSEPDLRQQKVLHRPAACQPARLL